MALAPVPGCLSICVAKPVGQVNMLNKKRAPRQQLEIEHLRREAKILEGELARLQQKQRQLNRSTHRCCEHKRDQNSAKRSYVRVQGYRTIAPRKPVQRFVWEEIAKRQWKERVRAENRNQELRSALEVEFVVGQQLKLLWQRFPDLQAVPTFSPRDSFPIENEENVFKSLLIRAENTLLGVDKLLQGSAYRDHNANYINASVVGNDSSTQAFVVHSSVAMPFGLQVSATALWTALTSDMIKDHCYYHHVAQKSNAVVAYSFGARYSANEVEIDFRGKYVVCRFTYSERIVIVLAGIFEPAELNGMPCRGVRCHKMAWIEVCDHRFGDTQHSLSRAHCRFTVEIDGAVNRGGLQMGRLFAVAKSLHGVGYSAVNSMLEKVLVEEDWKHNGWSQAVAV